MHAIRRLVLLLFPLTGVYALPLIRQQRATFASSRSIGVCTPLYRRPTSLNEIQDVGEDFLSDGNPSNVSPLVGLSRLIVSRGIIGTVAYNGENTAKDILFKRMFIFLKGKLAALSLSLTIDKFRKFGGMVLNVEGLIGVFKKVYEGESLFDKALFNAFKEMFDEGLKKLKTSAPFTVVPTEKDNQYILAFNDEKKMEKGLYPGLIRQSTLLKKLRPDHAVALFVGQTIQSNVQVNTNTQYVTKKSKQSDRKTEGNKDQLKASCILSVVELKHQGAAGLSAFTVDAEGEVVEPTLPSFINDHPFFFQELSYVIRLVWPGVCSYGLVRQEIPLAVLVGKESDKKWEQRLRYMRGTLVVPESCGDQFKYRIDDFATFEAENENDIVNQMVAVYLDSIYFGLNAAWEAVEMMDDKPVCRPLSGQVLKVAGEVLYPAGPLSVLATPESTIRHGTTVVVSQGELFQGILSGEKLFKMHGEWKRQGYEMEDCFWFFEPEKTKDYKVIVKASSCAVHPLRIAPSCTWRALKDVMRDGADAQRLKKSFSKVLLVAYKTRVGHIMVMNDLRREYEELSISIKTDAFGLRQAERYSLSSLWKAFRVLVLDMLLPLANLEIIHGDIRPGYDKTSNILVKRLPNNELEMTLIDLESLTSFDDYLSVFEVDGRYVPTKYAANAVEYLWWQCVVLAYVWSEQIDQATLQILGFNELAQAVEKLMKRASEQQVTESQEGSTEPLTSLPTDFLSWLSLDAHVNEFLFSKGMSKRSSSEKVKHLLDRIALYFEVLNRLTN